MGLGGTKYDRNVVGRDIIAALTLVQIRYSGSTGYAISWNIEMFKMLSMLRRIQIVLVWWRDAAVPVFL